MISCPPVLLQIAELKRTPPEGLQRRWRSIAERLA